MTHAVRANPTDTSPSTGERSWFQRVLLPPWPELTILLLAALTRFWRLGYHSIWFDESVSLKWAQSDPSYIWQVTFPLVQDKHPPLYYLYLHYWRQALQPFGLAANDAALRMSGTILGVLTVAGVMLLARRLSTRGTGLLAGALVGLSPFLVWYAQELRMFQPAATAIVWGACSLLLAWQAQNRGLRYLWWILFTISTIAGLYAYLFSAFLLPSAGLTILVLAYLRRSPRFLLEGVIALGLATAAFLPLANNAWLVNANESTPGIAFENFTANTARLIQIFTVWRTSWPDAAEKAAVVLYASLAVVGLALPRPASSKKHALGPIDLDQVWLLLWLGVPFLVANVMLSRSGSIFDEDRYLLFLAPFLLWAVARGVTVLSARSRALGRLGTATAVIPLLLVLPLLWTPAMARENWREAAAYVAAYSSASPGLPDAVIAHVDYTREPLEWYLRQDAALDNVPVFHPFGGTLRPEDVDTIIEPPLLGLVDFGTHTAWLTQSHLEGVDDQRLVERWFADNFPIVTELYPAGIKVSAYMLHHRYDELPELDSRANYPDAELAPGISLDACEIIPDSVVAQDDWLHPPSGWVHVRLWWRADSKVDADHETTAQVVGPEGVWGERLYREGEVLDRWPTSEWLPGETVREELDINLNPITPPGSYPVVIGLRDKSTGNVTGSVTCGEVDVR